jgi:hypothetical protein
MNEFRVATAALVAIALTAIAGTAAADSVVVRAGRLLDVEQGR